MGLIALEGIEFFAYHGFHKEEQKIGNKYGVDIWVECDFDKAAGEDDLSQTIDYEVLYKLIKKEIKTPSKLLENIAQRIIDRAFETFPVAKMVKITISKFNPPVGGVCNRARVTLQKEK